MKKYLILLFSLISVVGYAQTLHPNSGTTALSVNNANTLPTTVSGTNTYTATLPSAGTITDATNFFTDITDRLIYYKFTNAATSAPFTLNLNGEGAKDLKKRDATGTIVDIETTDIVAGQTLPIRYNGTYLVIEGGAGGGGISELEVGVTDVTSGTNTRVLYNNSGTLGEYAISGTGSVAMTNSPAFTTPNIGSATGNISGNAATVTTNANLTGHITSTGNAAVLGSFSSSNLSTALTDESGSGPAAFGTVASTATASTLVLRDGNANISANNSLLGYTTTVTAAGTTTLTVSSTRNQYATGTTTQTFVLPVTSTLVLGQEYNFVNNSTAAVTVQSSGTNTIQIMAANSILTVRCILTSGTGTASWSSIYSPSNPMTSWGSILYGGDPGSSGVAPPTKLDPGTVGYVLSTNGSGAAPSWIPQSGFSGLTSTRIPVATSSTTIADYNGLKYDDASRTMTLGYSSSGNNILTLGISGNGFNLNTSTGEMRIGVSSTNFMTLYSNNAERIRIPTTGNVLIGSSTDNGKLFVSQGVLTSSWLPALRVDAGAHTGMTASTAFPDIVWTGASQTWGSGTIAIQPKAWLKANTLNGTSGTNTATIAAGLQVDPWIVGTNAAITNSFTIYHTGKEGFDATITAGGTTGDRTINKPAGTVNIAAAGTTVTVTNSLCTTSSIVTAVIRTNDSTAYIKNVVPGAGSFVINLGAAATSEISIGFKVEN